MKTLYLDPFSGISGDMFLGLLIDLGVNPEQLLGELNKLDLTGWQVEWRAEQRLGVTGTRALVNCESENRHRHWQEIDELLRQSTLAPGVSERARRIFRTLGEAEARVHGISLEQVHFHEVGALDAIIDITGAAIGLQLLGVDKVFCAPLPLNHGFVQCEHGRLPLPAPAVAALLEGHPVKSDPAELELVTPTGAAIVVSIAEFSAPPQLQLQRVGYGVGGRELSDRPNLLRGFLGQTAPTALEQDEIVVLESNLDDSNPEWLGHLLEQLLQAGALDATFSPLQMKKNRPGQLLTVLARPEQEQPLARLVLRESSAIGIRSRRSRRYKLRREAAEVDTTLGKVAVKLLYDGEELLRVTPEYEACRELAARHHQPLPEVYRLAQLAANELFRHNRNRAGDES